MCHYKNDEVIESLPIEDGRHVIGDPGCTDNDGPSHTIGCKKDSTTIVGGKNALFGLTEEAT